MHPTNPPPTIAKDLFQGSLLALPMLFSTIPFGITYAALGIKMGLGPWKTILMSVLVYAGSAQLLAVKFAGLQIGSLEIWYNTTALNSRHLLYSIRTAEKWKKLSFLKKMLGAYFLTDEAFLAGEASKRKGGHNFWFFIGTAVTLWIFWQISTIAGVLLYDQIEKLISLEFLFIIMLTAFTAKGFKHGANLVTVLTILAVFLLFPGVPANLQILCYSALGLIAGFFALRFFPLPKNTL